MIQPFHEAPRAVAQGLTENGIDLDIESLETELNVAFSSPSFLSEGVTIVGVFSTQPARILREDRASDIAILGCNPRSDGPILTVDDAQPLEGEQIAVSGFPLDVPTMVTTFGHIAAHHVETPPMPVEHGPELQECQSQLLDSWRHHRYLADVRVNPGNNGGPAYRLRDGVVIGIASAYPQAEVSNPFQAQLLTNSGLAVIVPIGTALRVCERQSKARQRRI